MRDVCQVHQQLVVGSRVVLAEHLRVAGQASLGLQAQAELGHVLLVFGGDLGALRAGTHKAHLTLEDVDQLGQLVQAAGTDDVSHAGDARIVFAGGHDRAAVFFGVHAHASEFDDPELPAVLCQAGLPVERGAAVAAHAERHDREKRGQDQQQQAAHDQVEQPLCDDVLGARTVPLHPQDRQMEHMDAFRAAHDDVAHARDQIDADVVLHACLQHDVPVVRVHAAQQHDLVFLHPVQVVEDVLDGAGFGDVKPLFQAVGVDEFFHALPHVVDDHRSDRFVMPEIVILREDDQAHRQAGLHSKAEQPRQKIREVNAHHPDQHHGEHVRDGRGQDLTEDQLTDPLKGEAEAVQALAEEKETDNVRKKQQRGALL